MPDNAVAYADRFEWLESMLESSLDPTAKAILAWLWKNNDSRTNATKRYHQTIANSMQMKKATVRAALDRAKKAGWISWSGAGGMTRDDDGSRRGVANLYCMTIPANQLARTSEGCEPDADYVLTNELVRANEVASTCEPVSTNTYILPSSLPIDSLETANAVRAGVEEEGASAESTAGAESLQQADAPMLPIASLTERIGWSTMWPDAVTIEPRNSTSDEMLWTHIVNTIFDLLGWNHRGSNWHRPTWQAINEAIVLESFEYSADMLARYKAGQLTTLDVANVLAVAGINPPVIIKSEESDEEAA